jgi:excinuclease ABC subunit B
MNAWPACPVSVEIQYQRHDMDFHRGTFRVRGDVVDIFPAHEEESAIRVEFFGDVVDAIWEIDPLRGEPLRRLTKIAIYPASHYVTTQENLKRAIGDIGAELEERLQELMRQGKLLEAQRLAQRTHFDLEMLGEMGFCHGIENYSRHIRRLCLNWPSFLFVLSANLGSAGCAPFQR